MISVRDDGHALEFARPDEIVRIEPWGEHSFRVRAARRSILDDVPGALLAPEVAEPTAVATERTGRIVNGALTGIVEPSDTGAVLRFVRTDTGEELLAERAVPGARRFVPSVDGYGRLEQNFAAYEGERIYGLGGRGNCRLDQKGLVLDLATRGAEVSVPFLLSNRGYGFLWNLPALGRAEFTEDGTRWVAEDARQIDYWITAAHTPMGILSQYAEATGHPPMLPEWASGFWQSKIRYRSQQELLSVAHEHHARGLPLSVLGVDLLHWPRLGDWCFDPAEWPDPSGMVKELNRLGVRLMVSAWPSISSRSSNHGKFEANGLLVHTEDDKPVTVPWSDSGSTGETGIAFYDATNPDARAAFWTSAKRNYYDLGVRAWSLDGGGPEPEPKQVPDLRFAAGRGAEVANLYSQGHAQAVYDGIRGESDEEVVLLSETAWAGSQRYGVAVRSGPVAASWDSLRAQVRTGLNLAVAGIPWWSTDIGGFDGGNPDSPEFRELVVRWFQYAVFCPIFRLHGMREPRSGAMGGPNQVWSFGEEALQWIDEALRLRERLRPYLMRQMRVAHEQGISPMRPVFVDFPDDPLAWEVEDQFMLGPDILVAPVIEAGAEHRSVYLPAGAEWTCAATDRVYPGGTRRKAWTPLCHTPVYFRDEAKLPLRLGPSKL